MQLSFAVSSAIHQDGYNPLRILSNPVTRTGLTCRRYVEKTKRTCNNNKTGFETFSLSYPHNPQHTKPTAEYNTGNEASTMTPNFGMEEDLIPVRFTF